MKHSSTDLDKLFHDLTASGLDADDYYPKVAEYMGDDPLWYLQTNYPEYIWFGCRLIIPVSLRIMIILTRYTGDIMGDSSN
jgi:hypothetical protein